MKPILVHLHIFYKELYPELKDCLLNLQDYDIDLRVTLVDEHQEIEDDLKRTFKNCTIYKVPNLGFDVAPFIYVLNEVNLDDYSYVVKLHTKRDIKDECYKGHYYYGSGWRDLLLSFIKEKSVFDKVINTLETHPKIGMSGNLKVILNQDIDTPFESKESFKFIQEQGFKAFKYRYITGTMFIARACVFKELKEIDLKPQDFELPDLTHKICQKAHLIERFMGYLVYLHKMSIKDCSQDLKNTDFKFLNIAVNKIIPLNFIYLKVVKELLWQKIITNYLVSVRKTKKNKLLIKILKIPVFSIKLK